MEDLTDQARLALADMAWVRQLARALVRDDAAADDIAQDALLVAAVKAPADRPLRPWLHRVMLNLVRMRARADKRRDAREATVADAATQSTTPEELVARVEIQRVVASEVLELREPYRSTILMHFVEGLSSVEIARKLDIPDGTVRRRLKTALDELRTRLQARDDQPKGGWLAALVPLSALPNARSTPARATAISVSTLVAIGVALVGLVLGLWLWLRPEEPDLRRPPTGPRLPAAQRPPDRPANDSVVPAWLVQPGTPARRVAGTVTGDGKPLPFATVRLAVVVSPSQSLLVAERLTDSDGAFDFGLQLGASFVISAQAAKRMPAAIPIDVADPRTVPDRVAIDLDACYAQLVGTIRDASGGTVARARLTTEGQVATMADDRGEFSLCLPPGRSVRVDADGYGSREVRTFFLSGTIRQDVVLVPEAIVIGHVVDENRRPVAGAHVTVTPEGVRTAFGLAEGITTSDAYGAFRVTGVGPSKFRIAAKTDTLASATPTVIFARPGTQTPDLEIVVARRRRVRGHVTMGGAAVAGARFMLVDPQLEPNIAIDPGPTAVSQADGSFTIETLPGTFAVISRQYGIVSPRTVVVGDADATLEIEVSARATVHGRVVAHGVPVRNAEVDCMPLDPSTRTRTAADGSFSFEGLEPGQARIWAQEPSTGRFGFRDITVTSSQLLSDVDVELPWAAEVKGRVVDEAKHPVPDVSVRLLGPDGDWSVCPTNELGQFDCIGIQGNGNYLATVHPSHALQQAFAPAVGETPRIRVDGPESVVTGVELAITVERHAIRGRILDDTGAPLPDCHIAAAGIQSPQPPEGATGGRFEPPHTMSARDGGFAIGNLAAGHYNLAVMCPDNSTANRTDVEAGGEPLAIEVARAGRITGRLVGFATTPAVHTFRFTPGSAMGYMAVVTGDRFTFDGVPPGEFPVEAIAGTQMDGALVDVKPGASTDIVLTARSTATIQGRVVDHATGEGIEGAICQPRVVMGGFHGDLIPVPQSTPSDASGRFSVIAPLGLTRVVCNPPPRPMTPGGVDVALPSRDAIDVPLVGGIPVSDPGFVLQPMKLPLSVFAMLPGGPAEQAGLRIGDVLVAIDGEPVAQLIPISALGLIRLHPPGKAVRLTVERAGAPIAIDLVPAPMPPPP